MLFGDLGAPRCGGLSGAAAAGLNVAATGVAGAGAGGALAGDTGGTAVVGLPLGRIGMPSGDKRVAAACLKAAAAALGEGRVGVPDHALLASSSGVFAAATHLSRDVV